MAASNTRPRYGMGRVCLWSLGYARRHRRALAGVLAAMLLQVALTRSREYEADASGARLLHDGEPLARALQKIEAYAKQIPMNIDPAQAQAYIINPLSGEGMDNLFSTHPNTENRIAELEKLAAELGVSARSAPRAESSGPWTRSSAGGRA